MSKIINTIAVHNGCKVARQHNLRNRKVCDKENHIINDDNMIEKLHETWIDEKPNDAYEHLFGDALRNYNNLQKRNDRKIKDYYNHIRKSGNNEKPVYEMIVGIYKNDYINADTKTPIKLSANEVATNKEILKEFLTEFQKRNPNIYVCGAYYHADEKGTPHLHLDYIPFAHYDKGLKVRNSLSKALKEMNMDLDKNINPMAYWNNKQRELLDNLCKKHNITISYPTKDMKEKSKHLDKDNYIASEYNKLDNLINEKHARIQKQIKAYKHNDELINQQVDDFNKNEKLIEQQVNDYKYNKKLINHQDEIIKNNLGKMNKALLEREKEFAHLSKTNTKSKDDDLDIDL